MSPSSGVPDDNSSRLDPGMAAMREPEIIADFGDLNGEAPVWDPDTATLYWTDCVGFKFSRFQSRSGKSEILRLELRLRVMPSTVAEDLSLRIQKAFGCGMVQKA